MRGRSLGAILMILGTSIGAGMIALPVAAAQENYLLSLLLLAASWMIMAFGAFALLEVNLWFGRGTNIISMARGTLGRPGQFVAWIVYLLLLYSLLAAYVSGISDVIHALLAAIGINTPRWADALIAVLVLGYVIYRGIGSVDLMNRLLMTIKLLIYIVLVLLLTGKIQLQHLSVLNSHWTFDTVMVMLTSFGFANIIPSLVDYLDRDAKRVHRAVLIGSLIPMIMYAIWIAIIQGIVPRAELMQIAAQGHTVSGLLTAVQAHASIAWLGFAANIFISICAFTSFLGVALSMTDFLADGLTVNKQTFKGASLVYPLTFVPPILAVIFAPNIFIKGLSYAGICCIILLIILPLLMLLSGRHVKKYQHGYRIPGGWIMVVIGLIIASALFIGTIIN